MRQEEILYKKFDAKIARKLFSFVKPYKWQLVLSFICILGATGAELLIPIIIQKTIDNHVINFYKKAQTQEELNSKNLVVINSESYIKKTDRAVSKEKTSDENLLYIFQIKDKKTSDLISASPDIFYSDSKSAAIAKSDLKKLDPKTIKIIKSQDIKEISRLAYLFFFILITILLFSFVQVYLLSLIGQYVMRDIRLKMYSHVIDQSVAFFVERPVGGVVSRVTNDVETINELFTTIATSLFKDIFLMSGVIFTMFYINPKLAFITLLTLPPVMISTLIFRNIARKAYRKVRIWVSKFNAFLAEHISGVHIVQMLNREDFTKSDFRFFNKGLLLSNLNEVYVFAFFRPLVNLFTSVSIAVVIFFGSGMLLQNFVTLGVLIAFINLIDKFYEPVQDISEKFTILQSSMAGGERIFDLLNQNFKVKDSKKSVRLKSSKTSSPTSKKASGKIEFKNVNFSYKEDIQILKNISFTINPGEKVALVGYTGSGKTTITNLLSRFWDIDSGKILLDNTDIKKYPLNQLRKIIMPVPQDVFLFSGTIEDNIKLGSNISTENIINSSKIVLAHDFINRLPEKYNTVLNEGATNISTGERQLISFARVIAHDPQIIILDEATSNIDTETEKLIQEALSKLLQNRTSLIIAHRLSTIINSDKILVLAGGSIVESGSHDELIAQKGIYFNLYKIQFEDNNTN